MNGPRLSPAPAARAAGPRGADFTLPGLRPPVGHLHLIRQTVDTMVTTFLARIGFSTATGPEVEEVTLNFDALDVGQDIRLASQATPSS